MPYVSDIHRRSNKFRFYLFADDTNIWYADKNLRDLATIVNNELQNLYNWLTANKLTLNFKKFNFVIFHPYQKRLAYQPKLCMFDNEKNKYIRLESKVYIKCLGILIDQNLSWKCHIDSIVTKLVKMLGLLQSYATLRHIVPNRTLLDIYKSPIAPYITYGSTSWGTASKTLINNILVLQKCVLRLIHSAPVRGHAICFS